jgi:inosose dehydratase
MKHNIISIKLGIASVGWYNNDLPDSSKVVNIDQCLQEIRESGYEGTELDNFFPSDINEIKKIRRLYNIDIVSSFYSTYFLTTNCLDTEILNFKKRVKFLASIGAKCINVVECSHSIHQDINIALDKKYSLNELEWEKLITYLCLAGGICNQYNIRLAYHPHMGTVVQNIDEIEKLLSRTCGNKVSLCLDTGHLIYAGIDPIWFYEKYASRVVHIHFKDIRKSVLLKMGYSASFLAAVAGGIFTIPGDGFIPFSNLVKSLRKAGYSGWCIVELEQDPSKISVLDYAKRAHGYLMPFMRPS